MIGSNPCRKLRISFDNGPERPHAATDEVDALAGRMSPANGLMTITDAYTGLRWGELAGLQWIRTYLDDDTPHIDIDPKFGALHEVRGRLELGPPKTPASVRTVHLPPFLAVDDIYSHITEQMIEDTLQALQQRWEQDGGWTWQENPAVEPEAA